MGATSPVSVLVLAVLVGVILQLASSVPLLYYLPSNALSAVVIVALTNLLDFEHLLWLVVYDRKDALIWVTSFVAVLFLGVEIGILVAVLVSLALVTIETLVAPTPKLGMVAGNAGRRAFRSLRQYPDAAKVPGVVVLRIESPILFASAPRILSLIRSLVLGSDAESAEANAARVGARAVLLDLSNVSYVDSAFLCGFAQLIEDYKSEEVPLKRATLPPLCAAWATCMDSSFLSLVLRRRSRQLGSRDGRLHQEPQDLPCFSRSTSALSCSFSSRSAATMVSSSAV